MHKYTLLLTTLFAALMGCKEASIEIPTLTSGKKVVLAEELTGVRCPSCPEGTIELARLQGVYGKNLIVVSNHSAGSFSIPHTNPASRFDYRGQDFKDMAAFIGPSGGYPAASINRIVQGTEATAYAESRSAWGGYIASELQKDPGMDLFVINAYNSDTRELKATIRIVPSQEITDLLHLSVMITQDSIKDTQTVGPQKVPDYLHRHILRKLLTKSDGDELDVAFITGQLIERTYTFVLPADFESKHCSVVAAVHRVGSPDKAVLQAGEAHVEE
jgi:Outer membrane protein Omp28